MICMVNQYRRMVWLKLTMGFILAWTSSVCVSVCLCLYMLVSACLWLSMFVSASLFVSVDFISVSPVTFPYLISVSSLSSLFQPVSFLSNLCVISTSSVSFCSFECIKLESEREDFFLIGTISMFFILSLVFSSLAARLTQGIIG